MPLSLLHWTSTSLGPHILATMTGHQSRFPWLSKNTDGGATGNSFTHIWNHLCVTNRWICQEMTDSLSTTCASTWGYYTTTVSKLIRIKQNTHSFLYNLQRDVSRCLSMQWMNLTYGKVSDGCRAWRGKGFGVGPSVKGIHWLDNLLSARLYPSKGGSGDHCAFLEHSTDDSTIWPQVQQPDTPLLHDGGSTAQIMAVVEHDKHEVVVMKAFVIQWLGRVTR